MNASVSGPAGNGRLLAVENGYAIVERNGERVRQPFFLGCRMACLGADAIDPRRMIIAVEGGAFGRDDVTTDAIVFSISPDGLEAMLDQLRDDLQAHRDSRAIDMRFIV